MINLNGTSFVKWEETVNVSTTSPNQNATVVPINPSNNPNGPFYNNGQPYPNGTVYNNGQQNPNGPFYNNGQTNPNGTVITTNNTNGTNTIDQKPLTEIRHYDKFLITKQY